MSHLTISEMARGVVDAFSVRAGEQISVSVAVGAQLDVTPYIVMLARVPAMPDPCTAWSTPLCVIGAQWSEGQWHWMQFAPNTKELIGLHLEKNGAQPGKWYALKVELAGGAA